MGTEIEVKFLVKPEKLKEVINKCVNRKEITQGYLFGSTHFRVRNVIEKDTKKSYITIKGERDGKKRDEFEYEIPYAEGVVLLEKFCTAIIYKTRYIVHGGKKGKDKWEVDDFHGENAGLVIAELEIPQSDYNVDVPDWGRCWELGADNEEYHLYKNIDDDEKYYNYNLAVNPYSEWKDEG